MLILDGRKAFEKIIKLKSRCDGPPTEDGHSSASINFSDELIKIVYLISRWNMPHK